MRIRSYMSDITHQVLFNDDDLKSSGPFPFFPIEVAFEWHPIVSEHDVHSVVVHSYCRLLINSFVLPVSEDLKNNKKKCIKLI